MSFPMKLSISRSLSKKIRNSGIYNICFVDYDPDIGSYLKFVLNKRSTLYRQIEKVPDFLADILLLAKDTKEIVLKDGRSLILIGLLTETPPRLILIETIRASRKDAFNILNNLLEVLKNLRKEEIEHNDFITALIHVFEG